LIRSIYSISCYYTYASCLFTFNRTIADLQDWYIVDDVVMGGRSEGEFFVNKDSKGIFSGKVSLDNYGGFSSVRFYTGKTEVQGYKQCVFRIKGDAKRYQLRVKSHASQEFSYVQNFETSGEWETIAIDLETMYPTFRGRRLDLPNYPMEELGEISFLISNKKAEYFRLELDWMEFR